MAAHTIERHQAWHAIIAFGLAHTVRRHRAWHAIIALGRQTRSNDVWHGMTSPPLDGTNGRMTSGMAGHHRLLAAQMVERRRDWHAIIAFRQHTRWNDVGRGIASLPLESTHGRTTSGVKCHHHFWKAHTVKRRWVLYAIIAFGQHTRSNAIGLGMPASPLGSKNCQSMSGVA